MWVECFYKWVSLEFYYGEVSIVVVFILDGFVFFGFNEILVVVVGFCFVENEEMIIEIV